ncbi:MAG: patatin family protein [Lachnospiraceae bacterium]|nr:patatin family protein [Lachnospiraceae bacterium]
MNNIEMVENESAKDENAVTDKLFEAGLVLEGGGMRGLYTAGVLDYFIDKGIYFRNCYGVSAGATQGCSYISKQRGRAYKIFTKYMQDKRYASFGNLLKEGNYFGKDFSLKKIPDELEPYDYDTFKNSGINFYAVATNCRTGEPEYLKIEDMRNEVDMDKVWASCSLPLLSKNVHIENEEYLDGGVADSIPVVKAIKDGNKKVVLILTRDINYRKKPNKLISVIKLKYRKYPKFVSVMEKRHSIYNKTLKRIQKLENEGKIFVIRPKTEVKIGRLEKDTQKMIDLYNAGYNEAKDCFESLIRYLNS